MRRAWNHQSLSGGKPLVTRIHNNYFPTGCCARVHLLLSVWCIVQTVKVNCCCPHQLVLFFCGFNNQLRLLLSLVGRLADVEDGQQNSMMIVPRLSNQPSIHLFIHAAVWSIPCCWPLSRYSPLFNSKCFVVVVVFVLSCLYASRIVYSDVMSYCEF